MLMGNKTLTNLVDIAKILTCILNANDENRSESEMQLTDDMIIKAKYYFGTLGLYAWPKYTVNNIEFKLIKNNIAIYEVAIKDLDIEDVSISPLCGKDMSCDTKVRYLKMMKPQMEDGIRFFKVDLTREEEFAISDKAEELRNVLSEMMPQKGRNGR